LGILKEIVVIFQEIVSDPEFCIGAILKKLQSLDCSDFVLHADAYACAMAVHVRMRASTDTQTDTFLQSCGVADLITSCYSSKIQVMADTFIKAGNYRVMCHLFHLSWLAAWHSI